MNLSNKFFFFLYSFLIVSVGIIAQNKKIDSLQKQLEIHVKKDTTQVKILHQLVYELYTSNTQKAIALNEQAMLLSQKLNYNFGKAKSYYFKGRITTRKHNYENSFKHYNKALDIFTLLHATQEIIDCYSAMGRSYYMLGKPEKAIVYCKKTIELNKEINYTAGISRSFNNLGAIYTNLGNYEKAILYFKQSLEYRTKANNLRGMASTSNNIGAIYSRLGNATKSLEYFQKSLKIFTKIHDNGQIINTLNNIGTIHQNQKNYTKALEYYNKGLLESKNKKDKTGEAASLSHIANIHIDLLEYEKALHYSNQSLKINTETNNKIAIANSLNNKGHALLKLHKEKEAINNLKKALAISLEIKQKLVTHISNLLLAKTYLQLKEYNTALGYALESKKVAKNTKDLERLRNAYNVLYKIYKAQKNYQKGLTSHETYKKLNDSILNKENIKKITQLEYEYKYKNELESAEKRELKLTKTVLTTSENLEKSQRNLFLGIISFLIILLILGSVILFLKLRNEKSKTQNAIIEQKLLRSQMTPHFIFNSLSVLQGMILNNETRKSISYVSKFSKLLRIILENSRDRTVVLTKELNAIENYLTLQNLENEAYNYTITIASNINTSLFKIPPMLIQPFIENAIEHAFINKKENKIITITLNYINKDLICIIKDNGIGINTILQTKKQHKKSLSTTITSERLKMLSKYFKQKGAITIEDRKKHNEQGTTVTLTIPYKIINA